MSGPCWSEHGAFRAAFLERFRPGDRPALQKAGALLAGLVISGDVHHEPFVVSEFQAALSDARMLADYLRQIAEEGMGELESEAAELLARESWHWHREADDLVYGMAATFQDATGEWVLGEDAEKVRAWADPDRRARLRAALNDARHVEATLGEIVHSSNVDELGWDADRMHRQAAELTAYLAAFVEGEAEDAAGKTRESAP